MGREASVLREKLREGLREARLESLTRLALALIQAALIQARG